MDEHDFELITLPNGIRIVHKQVTTSRIAHVGIVFDIGSRDESPRQQGLAHFWEHMAFKGTKNRKAHHIINRLEVVGGDLNAYTTKEKVYMYASILEKHYERAFELLTDIAFHSTFPQKEIDKEKGVILEEMAMYQDSPEDAIIDDFEQIVFGDHPLGHNILGTTESVQAFTKSDFLSFIQGNLSHDRIIISSVGNIHISQIKKWATKYLSDISIKYTSRSRKPFTAYTPTIQEVKRPISQAHCVMGRDAYSIQDDKRVPLFLLTNLLGGPGMSSRLNMSLREKHGYVYSVEASYHTFVDTGLFNTYFSTDPKQVERSMKLIWTELNKLKDSKLGVIQLSSLKDQIYGQLIMAEESNSSLMQMMGKSLLDIGRVDSLAEVLHRIDQVSASTLMEVANEMFVADQMSYLTYTPDGVHS